MYFLVSAFHRESFSISLLSPSFSRIQDSYIPVNSSVQATIGFSNASWRVSFFGLLRRGVAHYVAYTAFC
jgi:hypothetical protein